MKLYHVAPSSARESIERHGIDATKSAFDRWSEGSGFHAFTDPSEARWYKDMMYRQDYGDPMDLWEVEATHEPTPDSGLYSGQDEPSSAVYHPEPVGPQNVRLRSGPEQPYREAMSSAIEKYSVSDWLVPAYGVPDDVKEQIHEWGKTLPWDGSAKFQDPSKYHITAFHSNSGFSNPALHDWIQSESGMRYPAQTHSLDTFTPPNGGPLRPIVMRFHAPDLSAHAEQMMDVAERHHRLPVSRFEGGHKPHITLGHNPESFPVQPPHIEFETDPLHELHTYYDALKNQR